jgi:hypothetical protein
MTNDYCSSCFIALAWQQRSTLHSLIKKVNFLINVPPVTVKKNVTAVYYGLSILLLTAI